MARNENREPIPSAESPDGPLCPRVAGETCQLGVGDDVPVTNPPQRGEDVALERRPTFDVDLGVREVDARATEVLLQPPEEFLHFRHRSKADTRLFRGYRRPRGWWAFYPTLGGGFTRAPARPRACTYRGAH